MFIIAQSPGTKPHNMASRRFTRPESLVQRVEYKYWIKYNLIYIYLFIYLFKPSKGPNLFMLKNNNEQLNSFGPIWSQFELGQRLRHKKRK